MTRSRTRTLRRVIVVFIVSLATLMAIPVSADAAVAKWKLTNSDKSYTGAIFHLVRKNEFIGQARIVEPGAPQITMSLTANAKDYPFGLKTWQPKDACLRIYEKWGPIWVRTHRYWSRDHGKDQWVTESLGDAGSKLRTKITRNRCPGQPRLV